MTVLGENLSPLGLYPDAYGDRPGHRLQNCAATGGPDDPPIESGEGHDGRGRAHDGGGS